VAPQLSFALLNTFAFPLWQLRLDVGSSFCFHGVTSSFNSCELRLELHLVGFRLL